MITWQEAVDRAIAAAQEAEKFTGSYSSQDWARAQAWAQISCAWSNIGMIVDTEAAEAEAEDAAA